VIEIGYYPGCALHGSSNDYETSARACLRALDVHLREIDDWICCGATAAHSLNHKLAVALPARNLGLAKRQGFSEVLAPCPMCSMELLNARKEIRSDPALRREMSSIVELDLEGDTGVRNLIEVLQAAGLDRIKAAVTRPLDTVRAACYYGCLLTRPPGVVAFDDPEQPRSMEALIEALGAKTVDWNFRTECCGAGMTMANEETVLALSNKILADASAHEANCIVTVCPMCHVNLDMKQADVERRFGVRYGLPIYYLSDLVGLAIGLTEAALAIDRHFVPASVPAAAEARG
jgi:heterodisulfide reductase subunit B